MGCARSPNQRLQESRKTIGHRSGHRCDAVIVDVDRDIAGRHADIKRPVFRQATYEGCVGSDAGAAAAGHRHPRATLVDFGAQMPRVDDFNQSNVNLLREQ